MDLVCTKISNNTSSALLLITFALTMKNKETVRYVALGDSYTICEGAKWEESWPYLLTQNLNKAGIAIELIANPSKTGWTTQQLIDNALPVFDSSSPAFATILIGVNDWAQLETKENFQKNLRFILDHVQRKVKNNLVLITIPDFSVTPEGYKYAKGRNISEGIQEFNTIIKEEARKRKLKCADLFPLTLGMKDHPELIATDGLHPSAKEYALWEKLIFPAAHELLNGMME